jgi:phage shock protein C
MKTGKKFVRPKSGRIVAGVAMGIANYFGISVTLVRIIWVLLLIPGGLPGLIPYLLLWAFMPSEESSLETKQTL